MHSLFVTDYFRKSFKKYDNSIKNAFLKQINKLNENPFTIGKPLNCKWIRELKYLKYRLYYVVSPDEIILLIDISTKKEQRKTIEFIKNNYEYLIENLSKGIYTKVTLEDT